MDFAWLSAAAAFFAVSYGFVAAFDRLRSEE